MLLRTSGWAPPPPPADSEPTQAQFSRSAEHSLGPREGNVALLQPKRDLSLVASSSRLLSESVPRTVETGMNIWLFAAGFCLMFVSGISLKLSVIGTITRTLQKLLIGALFGWFLRKTGTDHPATRKAASLFGYDVSGAEGSTEHLNKLQLKSRDEIIGYTGLAGAAGGFALCCYAILGY